MRVLLQSFVMARRSSSITTIDRRVVCCIFRFNHIDRVYYGEICGTNADVAFDPSTLRTHRSPPTSCVVVFYQEPQTLHPSGVSYPAKGRTQPLGGTKVSKTDDLIGVPYVTDLSGAHVLMITIRVH